MFALKSTFPSTEEAKLVPDRATLAREVEGITQKALISSTQTNRTSRQVNETCILTYDVTFNAA